MPEVPFGAFDLSSREKRGSVFAFDERGDSFWFDVALPDSLRKNGGTERDESAERGARDERSQINAVMASQDPAVRGLCTLEEIRMSKGRSALFYLGSAGRTNHELWGFVAAEWDEDPIDGVDGALVIKLRPYVVDPPRYAQGERALLYTAIARIDRDVQTVQQLNGRESKPVLVVVETALDRKGVIRRQGPYKWEEIGAVPGSRARKNALEAGINEGWLLDSYQSRQMTETASLIQLGLAEERISGRGEEITGTRVYARYDVRMACMGTYTGVRQCWEIPNVRTNSLRWGVRFGDRREAEAFFAEVADRLAVGRASLERMSTRSIAGTAERKCLRPYETRFTGDQGGASHGIEILRKEGPAWETIPDEVDLAGVLAGKFEPKGSSPIRMPELTEVFLTRKPHPITV